MTCRPVSRSAAHAVLVLSSLVLMLVSSDGASADESAATEALAPGSWSVQFSVQPNFTLGSYAGSTLSLKRHMGSGNALRLGVSLSGANRDTDGSSSGSSLSYSTLESTTTFTTTTGSAPRTTQTEQTSHRWEFNGSGGRLGVSAYF